MYVPPSTSYAPSTFPDALKGGIPGDPLGLQYSNQTSSLTYARDTSVDALPPPYSAQSTSRISAFGMQKIETSRAVLPGGVNSRSVDESGVSNRKKMSNYVAEIIRYDDKANNKRLTDALSFLKDDLEYTDLRASALEDGKNKFRYGACEKWRLGAISDCLRRHVHGSQRKFLQDLRPIFCGALLNSNTMRAVHEATKDFVKHGGDIDRVRFDTEPESAMKCISPYLSDEKMRAAVDILVTKPVGYKDEPTENGIQVWCDPAQKDLAQTTQAHLFQVLPSQSQSLKRSFDSTNPTHPPDPSNLPKQMRSWMPPPSTDRTGSVESSAYASPRLVGSASTSEWVRTAPPSRDRIADHQDAAFATRRDLRTALLAKNRVAAASTSPQVQGDQVFSDPDGRRNLMDMVPESASFTTAFPAFLIRPHQNDPFVSAITSHLPALSWQMPQPSASFQYGAGLPLQNYMPFPDDAARGVHGPGDSMHEAADAEQNDGVEQFMASRSEDPQPPLSPGEELLMKLNELDTESEAVRGHPGLAGANPLF